MENCYVVERVLEMNKQEICYNGKLTLDDSDHCLCGIQKMISVEVVCVKPVGRKTLNSFEKECIELLLHCCVMDSSGRNRRASSRIRINVETPDCVGNIRRGAQVCIKHAIPCSLRTFDIHATILLKTVVSRSEIVCTHENYDAKCLLPPIYPVSYQRR